MTYNVFSETLNPTQSSNQAWEIEQDNRQVTVTFLPLGNTKCTPDVLNIGSSAQRPA